MVQEGKEHIKGKWDFPGGGWENNESIVECVEREVLEETGYLTKAKNFIGIWKTESLQDGTETLILAFEAEIEKKRNRRAREPRRNN